MAWVRRMLSPLVWQTWDDEVLVASDPLQCPQRGLGRGRDRGQALVPGVERLPGGERGPRAAGGEGGPGRRAGEPRQPLRSREEAAAELRHHGPSGPAIPNSSGTGADAGVVRAAHVTGRCAWLRPAWTSPPGTPSPTPDSAATAGLTNSSRCGWRRPVTTATHSSYGSASVIGRQARSDRE